MLLSSVRLDKWLWAARFFKTRGLAQTAVEGGRVFVNQERVKVAHALRTGDEIHLRQGEISRTLHVLELSDQRGSAILAQALYLETAESVKKRTELQQIKRFSGEPARSIEEGRPTKRDRRKLDDFSKGF
jgi:ribosome-associated heat shock protein Hsp15